MSSSRTDAEATTLVHARSRGVPRLINIICDATLVFAYAEERRQIDASLVREALQELETTGVLSAVDGTPAVGTTTPAPAATAPPEPVATAPIGIVASSGVSAAVAGPRVDLAATSGRVLDARNWPPAPARPAGSDERRQEALDHREEALRQRERELAEQRRVLAEEYRLLRARHQPTAPLGTGGTAARRASGSGRDGRPEGLWRWLKRVMLGVSHQGVVDGNTR